MRPLGPSRSARASVKAPSPEPRSAQMGPPATPSRSSATWSLWSIRRGSWRALELDDVVAVARRPDVGEPVVHLALRDRDKGHLVIFELHVAIVRRVIRVGEADQAAGL